MPTSSEITITMISGALPEPKIVVDLDLVEVEDGEQRDQDREHDKPAVRAVSRVLRLADVG